MFERYLFKLIAVVLCVSSIVIDLNGQSCFLSEANDINLYEVNSLTGDLISTTTITVNQGGINEVYGIARNPVDGQVYTLYDAGNGIRGFGILDLETGEVDVINDNINNYRYQTMTFDDEGRCYAMTASFGDSPYLLREIDPSNGICVELSDLEDLEGTGQALGFNDDSGVVYRCEGGNQSPYYWQTLNASNYTVETSVLMSTQLDDNFPYFIAMCYQGGNNFLLVDDNTLYDVNVNGDISNPRSFDLSSPRISGIVLGEDAPIVGCTDVMACNFNEMAELDNQSCVYLPEDNDCAYCSGEIDGTGTILIEDQDGDGYCDDVDLCDGYDDDLLEGLDDLDSNGVVDCDDLLIQISNQICYMTEDNSTLLHTVQVATGDVLATTEITTDEGSIVQVYGIARNPVNELIYILYDAGNGIRGFGQLNVAEGLVFVINGDMNNYQYETMDFTNEGTCIALTASNDDSPYLLREIDINNGICSPLADYEEYEGFGQALVVDHDSDVLHRCEGGGSDSPLYYWQTISLGSYEILSSEIMPTQLNNEFPFSIAMCDVGSSSFLLTDGNLLYDVNNSGQISNSRTIDLVEPRISGIVLQIDSDDLAVGCTDPEACNFDQTAELDNGSCLLPEIDCWECNENNDGLIIIDSDGDGVCNAEEVFGCTDPLAINWNPDATEDDGSCEYEPNSVEERNENILLSIYPNPASSFLSIELQTQLAEPFILDILNVTGQIMRRMECKPQVGKNLLELNVSNLSSGLYFVKIQMNGNTIQKTIQKL